MSRAIVSVATGRYIPGLDRLTEWCAANGEDYITWRDQLPAGSPKHEDVQYAFKAYALRSAQAKGFKALLWCDACILPIKPLEPLWRKIEEDGYWMSDNGYVNTQWTCEAAYPLLGVTKEENDQIHHIVATTFGISMDHPIGREFLSEYYRLANNGSFCGPWVGGVGVQHRHDQTAASVIAHRLGMKLTQPPAWVAYRGREDESTILCADARY
jgi:hypothetical protein